MRYVLDTDIPLPIKNYSKSYTDKFIKYLITVGHIKTRTHTRYKIASVVSQVFFNNAYLSFKGHNTAVTVTLNPNTYSKAYICNGVQGKVKVSFQYTVWFFEFLESLHLGSLEKGGAEFESFLVKGKWKYKMVDTSVSKFHYNNSTLQDMEDLDLKMTPLKNVIILRDKTKTDLTFKIPASIKGIKDTLVSSNRKFLDVKIQDPVTRKLYTLQLKKIYNISFHKGGRMYDMGIQNLSKTERYRLLIDDKETCVHDFKAFETSLLYTMQGVKMEGDPYKVVLDGYKASIMREVGKMIMTRIYYCKSREELNASVSKDIAEKFNLQKMVEDGDIPEKRIPVGQIIDLLLEKHEPVMEYFFGEGDHDPSHIGSLVMDYILEYMVQNYKTAIIPVFDEVICDKDLAYEIQEVMKKAYIHVVGSDMNCMIVREK